MSPSSINSVGLVLLVPHGRSGSVLLQTLLDGHPEIVVLPKLFTTYPIGEAGAEPESAARAFATAHPDLWDTKLGYFGDGAYERIRGLGESGDDSSSVSMEHFLARFSELRARHGSACDRRQFLILLHLAYALACQPARDVSRVRHVLLHLHGYTPGVIGRIAHDFPDLRLLASIRDPRELFHTYRQRALQWRRATPGEAFGDGVYYLENYLECLTGLAQAVDLIGADRVCIVDLNALHRLRDEAMRRLAEWLAIAFDAVLTRCTVNGLVWWGNRGDGKPSDGFDPAKAVFRFEQALDADERRVTEHFTAHAIALLGYPAAKQPLLAANEVQRLMRMRHARPASWVNERGRPQAGWRAELLRLARDGWGSAPRVAWRSPRSWLANPVWVALGFRRAWLYVWPLAQRLLRNRWYFSRARLARMRAMDAALEARAWHGMILQ